MNKRALKTRQSIRKAYMELLMEKDANGITISELSARADIDRRTFYLHYATISDITNEILMECLEKLRADLNEHGCKDLYEFIKAFNRINTENLEFFRCVLLKDSCSPILKDCVELLSKEIVKQFSGRTSQTKEELEYAADYICFGIMGMYIRWFRLHEKVNVEDFNSLMHDVIANSKELVQKSL